MPLRAIVFDFDGVIANSEPLHYRAFRDVLAGVGIGLTEQEYYGRYLGFDDVASYEAIARDRGRTWNVDEIGELVGRKAVRMEALERDASVLFPGAAEAVRRAADAVPIAIASGALGDEIHRVLDREGLTDCFHAIVAAEDTPVSKPAPEPYLRAVNLLEFAVHAPLAPGDCVAIEDSIWGLESARAAGLRTIAVAQTYPRTALSADLVFDSIAEFTIDSVRRLWQA
jgi:beta-phosphoglucomutase-like phosphatase (HAD superfamily)